MKRSAGFSLLELVAVLSIFALVALIGVQVIQASVKSSERLTDISEQSADLAVGLALLRADLNAALPREFTPPDGGTEAALVTRNSGFSVSVGGLARLNAGTSGFGRVTWRFDRGSNRVLRQVWTSLTPGAGRPVETVVLEDIEAFELSSFQTISGWQTGYAGDLRTLGALPLGVRVNLTHARAKDIEVMVSLR